MKNVAKPMSFSEIATEIASLRSVGSGFLLIAECGVGKSTVADEVKRLVLEETGEDLPISYVPAASLDTYDYIGCPVPDAASGRTKWFAPDFWKTEKHIMLIDEIGQAPPQCTGPLLRLVLDGVVGDIEIHPETIIICTTNSVEHRAGCNRLSSALRERNIVMHLKPELAGWLDWFEKSDSYHPTVAEYLKQNPELLLMWDGKNDWNQPCPRNWAKVGKCLHLTQNPSVFAGIVGSEQADEFLAFVDSHCVMPTLNEILTDPEVVKSLDIMKMPKLTKVLADGFTETGVKESTKQCIAAVIKDLQASYAAMAVQEVVSNGGDVFDSALDQVMFEHAEAINAAMAT